MYICTSLSYKTFVYAYTISIFYVYLYIYTHLFDRPPNLALVIPDRLYISKALEYMCCNAFSISGDFPHYGDRSSTFK
jgi:hypothetical protein